MTTQTKALKLALEALEWATSCISFDDFDDMPEALEELNKAHQAITAIKEALAQPEQEPVAWGIIASNTGRICQVELDADEVEGHNPKHIVPLYTTPPQRTWVGLDDTDLAVCDTDGVMLAKYWERVLKEKNNGFS